MKTILTLLLSVLMSSIALANDPTEMANQCEQYGSFQNADGEWVTCEYEEPEEEFDGDSEMDGEPQEYQESEGSEEQY